MRSHGNLFLCMGVMGVPGVLGELGELGVMGVMGVLGELSLAKSCKALLSSPTACYHPIGRTHYSSSGALSAFTQKPPHGGILSMIFMSLSFNSKSYISVFSTMRFSLVDSATASNVFFAMSIPTKHFFHYLCLHIFNVDHGCAVV